MGPIKSGLWLGLFIFSSVCALFLVHYQRAPDNNHSQKPYQTNPAPTDPEQREFCGVGGGARQGGANAACECENRGREQMTDNE